MNIAGLARRIAEAHGAPSKGFVILNHLDGLWDMEFYPSIAAAMNAIGHLRHAARFRIVPATRRYEWNKRG